MSGLISAPVFLFLFLIGFTTSALFDGFETLHTLTRSHEHWELDEFVVAFALIGLASLIALAAEMRDPQRRRTSSMRDFISGLAIKKMRGDDINGKGASSAAVYIVELEEGAGEEVVNRATEQLGSLVGEHRLTFFRVR